MSKLSIFETAWIDIVFEGRNKEYGAYQLRRENPATTARAFFLALLIFTAIISIPVVINTIGTASIPPITDSFGPTITLIKYPLPPKTNPPAKTNVIPLKHSEPKPQQSLQNARVAEHDESTTDIPNNDAIPTSTSSASGADTGSASGTAAAVASGSNIGEAISGPYETTALDKMPVYPGGMEKFYRYVGRNFKTPEEELASGSPVKVLVSFVIEKDGSMTEIKVLQNPGYGLDKEAVRVLKSMKVKWEPGILNGKPVRVVYRLPIKVKMP